MDQAQNSMLSFFNWAQTETTNFLVEYDVTTTDVMQALAGFGIGFVTGIVAKRSLKYIILYVLAIGLLLTSLAYFEFIFFNTIKIKTVLGLQGVDTIEAFFSLIMFLFMKNKLMVTSALCGVGLGYYVA